MKDDTKNLLLIGGIAVLAVYLLRKKTTTEDGGGGGGTFISGLTDLSWLRDLIPQNLIPNISLTGGETALPTPVTDIIDKLTSVLPTPITELTPVTDIIDKVTPTPPDTSGLPDETTPPPTNVIPTSQTGLSLESSPMEILKGWILNTMPAIANLGTGIALVTGGAAAIGGGIFAYKALLPGTTKVFTGIGERIGLFFRGVGKSGGVGTLGMLPPGAFTLKTQAAITEGDLGTAIKSFLGKGMPTGIPFLDQWQGILGGVTVRGEGIAVAPEYSRVRVVMPTDIHWAQETVASWYRAARQYGGKYPITDRAMKTGEAPSTPITVEQAMSYFRGYNSANAKSSKKPLGGGQTIQGSATGKAAIAAAITAGGGSVAAYNAAAAAFGGKGI